MTPEEEQQMNRDELLAQLQDHPEKKLRLWRFVYGKNDNVVPIELEFLEVKFEYNEIVIELGDK